MKVLRCLFLFFVLAISYQANACDCKELGPLDSLRIISYSESDIVFLGELIEVDTLELTYTFRVIEFFKGDSIGHLIKGKYFDSCSKFPRDKCRWIIYADYREEHLIDINSCLASRSEKHPFCLNCYTPPPPPKPGETYEYKDEDKEAQRLYIEKAKADWLEEIEILRENERIGPLK